MSLLQYLVRIYVRQYDPDSGTEKAKSPLPEPSDINKAAIMTFDEVESELKKLMASIEGETISLHRQQIDGIAISDS